MNAIVLPPIGSRVRYREEIAGTIRTCDGEVIAHYPARARHHRNPQTGNTHVTHDYVGVKVDKPLPEWWTLGQTDRFAPPAGTLTVIS